MKSTKNVEFRYSHKFTSYNVNVKSVFHAAEMSSKIGQINEQSNGNKFNAVFDCITSSRFSFFIVVETWHTLIGLS